MRNLLVTLADRNYLSQAKQLFSSVYWNAGWEGDYLLLTHRIPEADLEWFRQRGILTREIASLSSRDFGAEGSTYSSAVTGKLSLFSAEFKKWSRVVFIDADCIVRYPLDALTRTARFAAARDWLSSATLGYQAKRPEGMSAGDYAAELDGYDPYAAAFNTGVFAFNTDLIRENSFQELCGLFEQYREMSRFGEQLWLNLYFYGQWTMLPLEYNLFASYLHRKRNVPKSDIDGVVLHFPRCEDEKGLRCWDPDNPFYQEWKGNLDRAELIDLKRIPKPDTRWPAIRHIAWGMWRLRFALRRDYQSHFRFRLRLRKRLQGLLAAPARISPRCRCGPKAPPDAGA